MAHAEPHSSLSERLASLEAQLATVAAERDAAIAERDKLRQAYERLLERYALLERRIFVAKAERVDATQLELEFAETKAKLAQLAGQLGEKAEASSEEPPPEEAPSGDSQEPPKEKDKPKGRRNLKDADLPEERVEILDPNLEGRAQRIDFEESYRLAYRRGGPVKVIIARAKYKVEGEDGVQLGTAEKPRELMRRGLLAPSLIARVLVAKYCFGLPFHRQSTMLGTEGVELDDGTMCRYAEHIGASLGPIVDACAKEAKETAFCLSTDATGVAIQPTRLATGGRQPCAKGSFFVVLADQDHVFFEYRRRQTSAPVCEMFRGFSGYIQADAHSVFDALFRGDARAGPEEVAPSEVGCWSHCRRKFWEAATAAKEPVAREALLRIRTLFQHDELWAKLPPNKRLDRRQRIARPLVEGFFEWLHARNDEVKDVRGLLRSACGYAVRQEKALRRFLEDGRLKMTNNHSERALRTIAVGRKNWLFFGSDDHAQAAANLFSLLASCKLHRLEPESYLAEVIRVMPYWPRERYLELAPRYWTTTRATIDPAELDRPLGPITVPPPAPKEQTATN